MRPIILMLIRAYQALTRSGGLGALTLGSYSGCRSWPTCSDFAYDTIKKNGVITGGAQALVRLARCHPFTQTVSS